MELLSNWVLESMRVSKWTRSPLMLPLCPCTVVMSHGRVLAGEEMVGRKGLLGPIGTVCDDGTVTVGLLTGETISD